VKPTPPRDWLSTQKSRKHTTTRGGVVALAAFASLIEGNPRQCLLDVAAAAGPRWFVAFVARDARTHCCISFGLVEGEEEFLELFGGVLAVA
jgi:hypothetical protein